jgi:hypothetical protein
MPRVVTVNIEMSGAVGALTSWSWVLRVRTWQVRVLLYRVRLIELLESGTLYGTMYTISHFRGIFRFFKISISR